MSNELTGRALDEAAAIAMGSYRAECDGDQQDFGDGHWRCSRCREVEGQWHESMPAHALVRAYSTDPATIPEMLAWLHQFGGIVELLSGPLEATVRIVGKGQHPMRGVTGATLNEALARLVVEVARARGKQ